MRPPVIASAPTRLDFGGGWTDVPPFPEERGGVVCAVAINRLATVRVLPIDPGPAAGTIHTPLAQAALDHAGVSGVTVELLSDFPVGAGLGGSSAAGVALAAALNAWRLLPHQRAAVTDLDALRAGLRAQSANASSDNQHSRAQHEQNGTRGALAEWSRSVEVDRLGIAGGRQDHYAAAFGGALELTFGDAVSVAQIPIDEKTSAALERRCIVIYTGESRISAATITSVRDAYRDRVPRVLLALDQMKSLALQMSDALRNDDIDTLGLLVGEHWHFQQSLHPAITTARIDAIQDAAKRAGALGLKALGASGGGCVVVIAPDGGEERIARAIAPLGELLSWRIAHHGVRLHDLADEIAV